MRSGLKGTSLGPRARARGPLNGCGNQLTARASREPFQGADTVHVVSWFPTNVSSARVTDTDQNWLRGSSPFVRESVVVTGCFDNGPAIARRNHRQGIAEADIGVWRYRVPRRHEMLCFRP